MGMFVLCFQVVADGLSEPFAGVLPGRAGPNCRSRLSLAGVARFLPTIAASFAPKPDQAIAAGLVRKQLGRIAVTAVIIMQLLWSLIYAVLALPIAYLISVFVLSWIHHGYVKVDPSELRRLTLSISALVFVASFLLERLH